MKCIFYEQIVFTFDLTHGISTKNSELESLGKKNHSCYVFSLGDREKEGRRGWRRKGNHPPPLPAAAGGPASWSGGEKLFSTEISGCPAGPDTLPLPAASASHQPAALSGGIGSAAHQGGRSSVSGALARRRRSVVI